MHLARGQTPQAPRRPDRAGAARDNTVGARARLPDQARPLRDRHFPRDDARLVRPFPPDPDSVPAAEPPAADRPVLVLPARPRLPRLARGGLLRWASDHAAGDPGGPGHRRGRRRGRDHLARCLDRAGRGGRTATQVALRPRRAHPRPAHHLRAAGLVRARALLSRRLQAQLDADRRLLRGVQPAARRLLRRWRHVSRNVALTLVTMLGMDFGIALGGAAWTEVVFGLPGLGQTIYLSVQTENWPVVQGIVIFTSICVIVVNLLVDVVYAVIDPRVRLTATPAVA
ncbi:MAG: ABC transporter permease [Actinobacteria bacterium]|nr:MAG: ABC transporter permease [Actinomycetota bacterium]